MVLLTGGEGRRLGAPKHDRLHPEGGSWAGHLVEVFHRVFPRGPIQAVGNPVPERPELGALEDPRQGPARALAAWAATTPPEASRWWVVACDQVRWIPENLGAWHARAVEADPRGQAWVLANHGGRAQFLGGFLGATLLSSLGASQAGSLWKLVEELPHVYLKAEGSEWLDVDSAEDLRDWRG
jgi:molybdopterin-guanine dinucleotide biosynthesis protein A